MGGIAVTWEASEMAAFVSEGIFPIGKNSFGDLLFIGVKEEHLGEILFRYHDKPKSLLLRCIKATSIDRTTVQ